MKLKHILLFSTVVVWISACNNVGSGTTNNNLANSTSSSVLSGDNNSEVKAYAQANTSQNINMDKESMLKLGYGYDSRTGMIIVSRKDTCMSAFDLPDNQKYLYSNPVGIINWSKSYTASDIGDMLGVSIEGGADFGLFSASVAGRFTREAMDTRNTLHFNYIQSISMDAVYNMKGLGTNILSQSARELLSAGQDYFTKSCGDSVVRSAKVGALFMVDVGVEFENHDLMEKFEGEVKGSILGIGYIVDTVSEFSRTNNTMSNVKVSIHQFGGDTTKLSEIFGNPDANGNYQIAGCNASNTDSLGKCTKFIKDVMNYGNGVFKNSIDLKDPSSLYTYDYTTSKYSQMGVKANLPILTKEEIEAREYLADTITQDRQMLQYLNDYQQQSFYIKSISAVTKDYISAAIKDYNKMISDYDNYQIVDSCYGDTANINTRCVNAANEVKMMRSKYQTGINTAKAISYAIAVNNPLTGNLKLVSANASNVCDVTSASCSGGYELYYSGEFQNVSCLVDTTPDNSYFYNNFRQYNFVGKSVYCDDGSWLYIKRTNPYDSNFGIAGKIVDGKEVEYNVSPSLGYNVQFFYPPSTDLFLFNPI